MVRGKDESTRLLTLHLDGDRDASDRLMTLVYDDLREIAAGFLRGERSEQVLQPTALVHEAYMRLIDNTHIDWRGRNHFRAMAAGAMRRVLVDAARARHALKRERPQQRITLRDVASENGSQVDLIALHDALELFAREYPRQAKVVELRYFGGLGVDESADALGISQRTAKRDWQLARAWLLRKLSAEGEEK